MGVRLSARLRPRAIPVKTVGGRVRCTGAERVSYRFDKHIIQFEHYAST
jgi:hypothetical protein